MDYSLPNGTHNSDGIPRGLPDLPSLEQLEHELPSVTDGQVPLGELVSRIAQAVYAELTELAETYALVLPSMQLLDSARSCVQHAPHARHPTETNPCGMGSEDEKASSQALRCSEVVEGCECRAEGHGAFGAVLTRRRGGTNGAVEHHWLSHGPEPSV